MEKGSENKNIGKLRAISRGQRSSGAPTGILIRIRAFLAG